MLKIGLIAEFNPFHNGHKYLINQIKKQFKDCFLVVALSDDYNQRGEITIANFKERKLAALSNGVDKVIKLDLLSSTQAAHVFAKGAIDLLLKENINILCFGVSDENADINTYITSAQQIKNNKIKYDQILKEYLNKGFSYAYSTLESLKKISNSKYIPKDILGFEYTKYIINNNLSIKPFCFKRTIDSTAKNSDGIYATGSYIRQLIDNGLDYSKYTNMVIRQPIKKIEDLYSKFQQIVFSSSSSELSQILLMDEGMENLFKKNIHADSYSKFVNLCVSKRYTKSRIKRIILYTILDIKK